MAGRSPALWALRAVLALGLVALGAGGLGRVRASLAPDQVLGKDFVQEYVLARAVAAGADPYRPTAALAELYLGPLPRLTFPHPTPHPPPVGVALLPLAWLDYPTAAAVWAAVGLACLLTAVYLLGRAAGRPVGLPLVVGASLALLAWYPFVEELVVGQLMLPILALLAGARLAWLAGRSGLAGALLGLATLLKPVTGPLLLLLALRRDWRAAAGAAATLLLGYALAAAVVGVEAVATYFAEVLPAVAAAYRASDRNLSLWSVGWRLFDGTRSDVLLGVTAPPLASSAPLAAAVAVALPALALLGGALAQRRLRRDTAFGLLLVLGPLTSPLAWGHYLVLAALPAAQVVGALRERRLPARETNVSLLLALPLLVSVREWERLGGLLAGGTGGALPFWAALPTLTPTLALAALGWWLAALDAGRRGEPATYK